MRNTFSNISNIKERKENLNNEKKNAIDFSNLSVSEVVKNKDHKDQSQFVFSINKVKIMYDNEEATIVYFKDVTFGVLYEQIKAQKSF